MKNNALKTSLIIALTVLLIGCIAAKLIGSSGSEVTAMCTYCNGAGCDECENTGMVTSASQFAFSFWALIPPIVAIALALITKEVFSSLFIGILLGCVLSSNANPIATMDTLINDSLVAAILDNGANFLFLVILGILVSLMNISGGSAAFGRWAEKNIKSRTGVMLATFLLGVLIFVDDYFNCLTVGSVMQPVSDRHKISRAKLSYLIDATAAPICMIAPISSWAAAVTGVVEGDNGIKLFVNAIPWNYYSLLTIVFVIAICLMKFDFGPMKLHEMNAKLNGDLYTSGTHVDEALQRDSNPRGRVLDLVLPVAVLIVMCVLALIYVGGFWDASGDYYMDFVGAFGNTDAFAALPWGSMIALLFTIIYYMLRKVVSFKDAMKCIPQGFMNMVPAITILTLANGLKNVVNGCLGAKYFIGNLMMGASASLFMLLPAVIFLVGCILSFATGTSWGTFGILIPIVSVMFAPDSTLFYVGIGACLAGAVFGDHCSPISDTTIMASAGGMCDHVNHVSTQIPYAAAVGAICFVNYLLAGFIQSWPICLAIGVVMILAELFILKKISKKQDEKAAKA